MDDRPFGIGPDLATVVGDLNAVDEAIVVIGDPVAIGRPREEVVGSKVQRLDCGNLRQFGRECLQPQAIQPEIASHRAKGEPEQPCQGDAKRQNGHAPAFADLEQAGQRHRAGNHGGHGPIEQDRREHGNEASGCHRHENPPEPAGRCRVLHRLASPCRACRHCRHRPGMPLVIADTPLIDTAASRFQSSPHCDSARSSDLDRS